MTTDRPAWWTWAPESAGAAAVLVIGLLTTPGGFGDIETTVLVTGIAAAVLLCRRAPTAALGLIWAVAVFQLLSRTGAPLIELAALVVAFGCARWGRVGTVVLSGLSIPAALLCAGLILVVRPAYAASGLGIFRRLTEEAVSLGRAFQISAIAVVFLVLGLLLTLPWLGGLALRFSDRAKLSDVSRLAAQEDAARAQRETAQAQEIAQLRAEQNRLARDVHDVVGHSLAVILAQAESAQYLPDSDPEALKKTMTTIATSARTSLKDVRQVLSAQPSDTPGAGELDSLVGGARTSGHDIVSAEAGTPRPLPPELAVVAFRVLQEMLTNAIRHGRRDRPVLVGRLWPDEGTGHLQIEVRNAVDTADGPTAPVPTGGQGLDGMRRRLESVGGSLEVRRQTGDDGPSFTATATVPVRAGTR